MAISRALTPYKRLLLPAGVPNDKRIDALRLQALDWSPYARTDMLFDLSVDGAGVWIWDRDRAEALLAGAGRDPIQVRLYPETALKRPLTEGTRLAACLDGVEGQVWRDRSLVASRWWPRMPDGAEWLRFQRSAGQASSAPVPLPEEPVQVDWLRRSWPRRGAFGTAQRPSYNQLGIAAAVLMVAVTAFQVGEIARLGTMVSQAKRHVATLATTAKPLETARSQALAANDRAKAIFGFASQPSQLALMARIAERLPTNDTLLSDWTAQDPDLRFTLINGTQPIDSSFIVRAIEGIPGFTGVQVDPAADGKSVTVRLKVQPR
ncbi:MAG: hypothetical protein HYR63_23380 [Proteobacteria bacterium]|nr:hypothetical protein [Pseudomonadota bacterium]